MPIDKRRPMFINRQNAQNGIADFLKICAFLLLTSARWVWYNKTRAADGARAVEFLVLKAPVLRGAAASQELLCP